MIFKLSSQNHYNIPKKRNRLHGHSSQKNLRLFSPTDLSPNFFSSGKTIHLTNGDAVWSKGLVLIARENRYA